MGDDAAVIAYPEGLQTLVTTDLLLEGIHFDLTYTPLRHLGYKAAVGSFSDIYAMMDIHSSSPALLVSRLASLWRILRSLLWLVFALHAVAMG